MQLAGRAGITPLHEAASNGHYEAVKVLLSVGASNDATDQVSFASATWAQVQPYCNFSATLVQL